MARHLLRETDKTILLLEKRADPAAVPQKVGESLVQLGGYYFSKVLDLEEHLLRQHYLKYNLRFYWKTPGRANTGLEDYSQSYIRSLSNIPTFQLDRNLLERFLLEQNRAQANFQFAAGLRSVEVQLSTGAEEHRAMVDGQEIRCRWIVDASGRSGALRRLLSLDKRSPIRHNATFCWVEGLVDIEKLTDRTAQRVRVDRNRHKIGSFPLFLGTNHFCAEGQWFWVIPLHGKTSLGLVYDPEVVPAGEVSTARGMIDYACRQWPLFARDLPSRRILGESRRLDYAYDARQTIGPERWALTGEAGRFSDPLYSPGSDLIAIYNTLIVDAIRTDDPALLEEKCGLYDAIMRVMYEAFVPSYALSYNCLGDQEAFTLKYSWELAVYFGFYVMPFINDLTARPEFMRSALRKFALLGPVNRNLQTFLAAFYRWKKNRPRASCPPLLFDYFDMIPLRESERLFYEIGVSPDEAVDLLDVHLERLEELARYVLAHVHASVLGDKRILRNAEFLARLNLRDQEFDPLEMQAAYRATNGPGPVYEWKLNPMALEMLLPDERMSAILQ